MLTKVLTRKNLIKNAHPKAFEWIRLISITGGAQIIVQLTGFLSGILIIRLLPTHEYAYYTLANTMLGTMAVLSDSGVANGVMAEGAKVWQDKQQLGAVLETGLKLRKKFGLYSLLFSLPILAYLLLSHGAGWLTTILISLSLIPAFIATLSDILLEVAPKLHQAIAPLQRNQTEVSLGRLALSGIFLFVFPFTFVALLANGIPRIYGNFKLEKINNRFLSKAYDADPNIKAAIMRGVKRTLPLGIYFCLSGQISIWLLSFFGSTSSISQIGAIGRLSMFFTLVNILFLTLIVPRFSRLKAAGHKLLKTFLLIQLITFIIAVCMAIAVWLFSDAFLWVLGKNYFGLNYELLLIGIAGSIGLMGGVSGQLVVSRGWFLKPFYLIGLNIIATVLSILYFDMTSLTGILYFNIVLVTVYYCLIWVYGLIEIRKTYKEND